MAEELGSLAVKIRLDSSGFQNGISSINRSLRVLDSEFKANTAALGENGKGIEGLKLKSESLSKQLELQKQKVSALEQAYIKSAEIKGKDSKATQDLEIKLNKAKQTLSQMENELSKTNKEIETQGSFICKSNIRTTTLTLENSKSYAFIPGQDQGKAYTVQEGSYIQANIKYLMVDGNDIKNWDTSSSSYVKVSELPLTADKFQSYGDDNYHKERTGLVSTSPVLKIWSPLAEMPAPVVTQTIKPRPVIVKMKEDILFTEAYIVDIANAVVALDNTGSGIIVFIVSTDSGVSWRSWNGSSWVLVDIANMEDVKTKGMIVTILQGITETQWTALGISDKKIRFAWYMEIVSGTDVLKLKEIRVNYNTI